MLVDAHAHLDKYDNDQIGEVLADIERRRILTLSVSVDPESFTRTESIAARSPLVVPSFGIHPENAPLFADSLTTVEELAVRAPMIGEIGLDHRFVDDETQYGPQREVFASLLEWAGAQGKVVNLHCSGAEGETLDMLASHRIRRAIVHWYSGPLDVLSDLIAAGYLFTVGVEVLHSVHIQRVAQLIPDGQLLTETDNPGGLGWLTGEIGRPSHLAQVLEELGRLRAVQAAELMSIIHGNLARLVQDDPHLVAWRPQLGG
ncbi:MAG: TatD family hydrolase [Acidimicrobiia bacterium]